MSQHDSIKIPNTSARSVSQTTICKYQLDFLNVSVISWDRPVSDQWLDQAGPLFVIQIPTSSTKVSWAESKTFLVEGRLQFTDEHFWIG